MLVNPLFQAGDVLARKLRRGFFDPASLVLALSRGGVPVAYEIAQTLHADLRIAALEPLPHAETPETETTFAV